MKKIALVYGALAGAIVIGVITIGILFSDTEDFSGSQTFGYLIMLLGLSLIFFGVKRYRDRELGGVIKFAPALFLGLAIAGVAGFVYTALWEVYLASTNYAFIEQYAAGTIEAKKAAGASEEEIAKLSADMEKMIDAYGKAYFRLPITFLEIFPVGIIVSLISAAVLRNPNVLPDRSPAS